MSNQIIRPAFVQTIQRLMCEGCGAEANASCNCGKPYIPKSPSARATDAVKDHPEKSNRALAAEIGVDEKTVRTVRNEISRAEKSAPEKRTGKDGKTNRRAAGTTATKSLGASAATDADWHG